MAFIETIKTGATNVFHTCSASAGVCLFLGSVFAFVCILCLRGMISGLLAMHKSTSKMKKIRKRYSFWEKVFLLPAWKENEHAISFCKRLVIMHHIRLALWLVSVVLILFSGLIPVVLVVCAYLTTFLMLLVDIPMIIFHTAMDRYPFKRLHHEYRFRKYHNTQDHDSLF